MGVQLNTGDTGKPVSAEADGSLYRNIFGDGFFVLESGNKFKAEIQSNNKIKIYDGDAIMQGRHICTPPNDSTTVTIDNGAQGKNRIDLIVMRYKKSNTGTENAELVVIKGKETNEVPEEPETVDGNILLGETTKECVMYAVKLNGINITSVDKKFKTLLINMSTIYKSLSDNVSEIGDSYIKFSNGFLLQWGTTTHGRVSLATSDVNLQIPYRDAGYRVILTPGRNGNLIDKLWVGNSGGNNINKTPNHFDVSSEAKQTSYDRAIEWVTIGRWK